MEAHFKETDLPYEEDLARNAQDPEAWFRYLEYKRKSSSSGSPSEVYFLYERAVKCLPWSYKLWKAYLDERTTACMQGLSLSEQEGATGIDDFEAANEVFERCLVYQARMPRIWLDYISFLLRQRKITLTRRTINRAVQALPISQHHRVWELALKLAKAVENRAPKTCLSLWSRHWQLASKRRFHREYYDLLMRLKEYDVAAKLLLSLAEETAASNEGASLTSEGNEEEEEWSAASFWDRLCNLIMAHGEKVTSVDPEHILRVAIKTATETSSYASLVQTGGKDRPAVSCGVYWTALAMLRIRRRQFDGAREVYEEALVSVPTVRDFSIVFDAFARFEESLLAADLERKRMGKVDDEALLELDTKLARLEGLFERRPFLVQEIRLKQQPQKVAEWMRFIDLHEDPDAKVSAFERALTSINPKRAKGDLPGLWNSFATYFESFYDNQEDKDEGLLESCIDIFEKAVESTFGTVEEQAQMWIHYAEFKRRHGGLDDAIDLLGRPTAPASGRVSSSPAIWNYLVDLEEARGTAPEAIKAAYERIMSLGIATLQNIFNYAQFYLDLGQIDDAFRVYERGIAMFGYPLAFDLWNVYLPKATQHWAPLGRIERIRDLYEQALIGCPEKHLKTVYLMLVAFEEEYGISAGRNALRVLERACTAVPPEDKLELFRLLLQKTISISGLVSARPVYEAALTSPGLSYSSTCLLAQEHATLEQRLGEDERARAIFAHVGSQGDPRTVPSLWQAWADFEVARGNEESFREMLRVKRAAQAKFMTMPASFVPAQQQPQQEVEVTANEGEAANEDEIQLYL